MILSALTGQQRCYWGKSTALFSHALQVKKEFIYLMRDYLIYTSAGSAANIKQWYTSTNRKYDIWVTNYTNTASLNREYSDFYNEHIGSKFQNLKYVFQEHSDLLSKYKAIWVADDDIIISPNSLNALFKILENNDLWMLQPAFSLFGKISHIITKRKLFSSLRYTNFVEVTCPLFKTDKLFDFLSVYDPELSTCYGLDWWFSHHFGIYNQNRYAISDTYYCINPYDYFKSTGRREIDLLNSPQDRILMGETIKRKIGINGFEYKEYHKIQKNIIESICSVPAFALEVLFVKALPFLVNIKQLFRTKKSQTYQAN